MSMKEEEREGGRRKEGRKDTGRESGGRGKGKEDYWGKKKKILPKPTVFGSYALPRLKMSRAA